MSILTAAILKVASRCNLNCSYCYMYNLADKSFKIQPKVVANITIENTFRWIATYCQKYSSKSFHLILHGGEPLLAGKSKIQYIAEKAKWYKDKFDIAISLSLLTNGTLLDNEWLELFNNEDIGFSISIDGPAEYHDRFRRDRTERGSHKLVETWIKYLIDNSALFPSFGKSALTVLHPDMDGAALVQYFYQLGLKKIDFLLPDQNYVNGSDCYPSPDYHNRYSKVLIDAYNEWRRLDDSTFKIRKFELLILAHLGLPISLDSIGNGPIKVFTIETNGEIEPVDSMKICGNNFTKSGVNINQYNLPDIHELPIIKLGLEKDKLSNTDCLKCSYYSMCGGGYLPHRFNNGQFDKTVYCSDMLALCSHIENDLLNTIDKAINKRSFYEANSK